MGKNKITEPTSKAAPDGPDLDALKSIPVGIMQFTEPQDGPGLIVRTSLTSIDQRKGGKLNHTSKHTIVFIPSLASFRVKYHQNGQPIRPFMIGLNRVSYWTVLNE